MAYYEAFMLKTADRKLLSVLNLEVSELHHFYPYQCHTPENGGFPATGRRGHPEPARYHTEKPLVAFCKPALCHCDLASIIKHRVTHSARQPTNHQLRYGCCSANEANQSSDCSHVLSMCINQP